MSKASEQKVEVIQLMTKGGSVNDLLKLIMKNETEADILHFILDETPNYIRTLRSIPTELSEIAGKIYLAIYQASNADKNIQENAAKRMAHLSFHFDNQQNIAVADLLVEHGSPMVRATLLRTLLQQNKNGFYIQKGDEIICNLLKDPMLTEVITENNAPAIPDAALAELIKMGDLRLNMCIAGHPTLTEEQSYAIMERLQSGIVGTEESRYAIHTFTKLCRNKNLPAHIQSALYMIEHRLAPEATPYIALTLNKNEEMAERGLHLHMLSELHKAVTDKMFQEEIQKAMQDYESILPEKYVLLSNTDRKAYTKADIIPMGTCVLMAKDKDPDVRTAFAKKIMMLPAVLQTKLLTDHGALMVFADCPESNMSGITQPLVEALLRTGDIQLMEKAAYSAFASSEQLKWIAREAVIEKENEDKKTAMNRFMAICGVMRNMAVLADTIEFAWNRKDDIVQAAVKGGLTSEMAQVILAENILVNEIVPAENVLEGAFKTLEEQAFGNKPREVKDRAIRAVKMVSEIYEVPEDIVNRIDRIIDDKEHTIEPKKSQTGRWARLNINQNKTISHTHHHHKTKDIDQER